MRPETWVMLAVAVVAVVAVTGWRRIHAWLERRAHDERDLNCVHWSPLAQSTPGATCAPCLRDGGFAERRRMGEWS